MIRVLPVIILAGCTTVNQPMTYTAACNSDPMCQRNKDAETLHYIGQTKAALEIMCPDLATYGSSCVY
jgi:hypothetical protein